jgi:single-strand DNA-binding protein
MNKVILIGNLGKDPEVRQVKDTSVAQFSLATTTGFGDNKKTQWHNVTLWGKTAEIAGQYLKKGNRVCIVGEINYREYEKDGEKKFFTEIVGRELEMLTAKAEEQETSISQETIQNAMPTTDDGELPF